MALVQQDFDRAVAILEQALRHYQAAGDEAGAAWVLVGLGNAAGDQGDPGRATKWYSEALRLYRRLGDQARMVIALLNLGSMAQVQGQLDQATVLLKEALALARQIGDIQGMAAAADDLGEVAQAQGNVPLAASFFQDSLRHWEHMARHFLPEVLVHLAGLAAQSARPEPATRLLGAAMALHDSLGTRPAPIDQPLYDQVRAVAQGGLDPTFFTAAWETGQALSLEDAVADALTIADELANEPARA